MSLFRRKEVVRKKNPDRIEFDVSLHVVGYKAGKTRIKVEAPGFIQHRPGMQEDLCSAFLEVMARHGIGNGPKNLRRVSGEEEGGGA